MKHLKALQQYGKTLDLLYVEDNLDLRENTAALFENFFRTITLAKDGLEGLELYNRQKFDIVITDINMPRMNGVEMITQIKEINPEQKIVTITAHNEPEILIDIVKQGVSGFILKPMNNAEVVNSLYPVCRDAYTQNLNIALVEQLNEEKAKLEEQYRALKAQSNTIDTKHRQLEQLLVQKTPLTEGYFAKDADEGQENVVLLPDDSDELSEIFTEIPELISRYSLDGDRNDLVEVAAELSKAASIMFHYAPYLDSLATTVNELSTTVTEHLNDFATLLETDTDSLLMLFDAVSSDMERYVERFRIESMAMHNAHHIHEPTALSIRQIIGMIVPEEVEYGDMDFF